MRKQLKTNIILVALFTFFFGTTTAYAQPEYAKWGRKAMEVTHAKYPNAMITDYKHLGRKQLNANTSQESFKLQLKEGTRTFYVTVKIAFNKQTEKINNISFEETQF